MLAKMRENLRMNWKQVQESTITWLPQLNANEQTHGSWARHLKTYAEVPPVFKGFFQPFLEQSSDFPYAVLTPSYEGFLHRTSEKLICAYGDEVAVLERHADGFTAQCYPVDEISYVEFSTILLDSRITFRGLTGQGAPAVTTLKFNSITDYLFTPILEKIRSSQPGPKGFISSTELEKFDQWVRVNYKFMSYARRSLLGGERVLHTILQPEIQARLLTILGKSYYRRVSPAHMCILTDHELIMFREETRQGGDARYGGTWDYIPVNKIENLSRRGKDEGLLVLSIQLPEGICLEYLYKADAERKLNQLIDRYLELISIRPALLGITDCANTTRYCRR